MDYSLSDEQKQIVEAARKFALNLEFARCFGLKSNDIGGLIYISTHSVATKAVFFLLTFI